MSTRCHRVAWPVRAAALLLAALALRATPVQAQAAASATAYAQRYAALCAGCHGAQGVSAMAMTPSLAGQPSFYAITQLFLFRDGRRDNALMTAVAKGLSDADLRGFADHIGRLPPAAPAPADDAAAADAQQLARGASLGQRLHCSGCHGADYAGGKQVPRLAGQRADYLLHALQGFASGRRLGYTPAMTEALAGTTPEQLVDLALYLSQFGAAAAPPRSP